MKRCLLFFAVIWCVSANAQKENDLKLIEGNLGAFKGQRTIALKFATENLVVDGKPEEEYITDVKKRLNDAEQGKGDDWEKKWRADPLGRFQPRFKELFLKYSTLTIDGQAPYMIVFRTIELKPGGPGQGLVSYLTGEAQIIDRTNNKPIATFMLTNMKGKVGGAMWDRSGLLMTPGSGFRSRMRKPQRSWH